MTLNYMGRCKALNDAGEVGANSKPHLWPRRGCNCYNGARVPTCARFHFLPLHVYIRIHRVYIYIYIALTLLGTNFIAWQFAY